MFKNTVLCCKPLSKHRAFSGKQFKVWIQFIINPFCSNFSIYDCVFWWVEFPLGLNLSWTYKMTDFLHNIHLNRALKIGLEVEWLAWKLLLILCWTFKVAPKLTLKWDECILVDGTVAINTRHCLATNIRTVLFTKIACRSNVKRYSEQKAGAYYKIGFCSRPGVLVSTPAT